MADFETEFYKELSKPKKVDNDMETRSYHLVDGYETVNPDTQPESDQAPQRQEFSILLGEFDQQKHQYLHDYIQSYYKQYVTSEESIYFFKYESEDDLDK